MTGITAKKKNETVIAAKEYPLLENVSVILYEKVLYSKS